MWRQHRARAVQPPRIHALSRHLPPHPRAIIRPPQPSGRPACRHPGQSDQQPTRPTAAPSVASSTRPRRDVAGRSSCRCSSPSRLRRIDHRRHRLRHVRTHLRRNGRQQARSGTRGTRAGRHRDPRHRESRTRPAGNAGEEAGRGRTPRPRPPPPRGARRRPFRRRRPPRPDRGGGGEGTGGFGRRPRRPRRARGVPGPTGASSYRHSMSDVRLLPAPLRRPSKGKGASAGPGTPLLPTPAVTAARPLPDSNITAIKTKRAPPWATRPRSWTPSPGTTRRRQRVATASQQVDDRTAALRGPLNP